MWPASYGVHGYSAGVVKWTLVFMRDGSRDKSSRKRQRSAVSRAVAPVASAEMNAPDFGSSPVLPPNSVEHLDRDRDHGIIPADLPAESIPSIIA